MIDCQVFVELGMTKPKSKVHSSNARPYRNSIYENSQSGSVLTKRTMLGFINVHTLNSTFCSNRKFSNGSMDEKFISLETALQFSICLGTLASCSTSGWDLNL